MNHGDHSAHQHSSPAPSEPGSALPGPVEAVFTNYLNIQASLAQDSLEGLRDSAADITQSIENDPAKTFSGELARAAGDLAKTTDINDARLVFRRLSGVLIKDLGAHPDYASHLVKAFCPMANAMWLQAGPTVNNPYLGKTMARCGRIEG